MKLVKLFLASSLAIIIGTLAFADTVLLSMKGPGAGNPFWASVERGGREKAAELGVKIVVLAPPQESDVQSQINQVEDQITKGVTAIAIAVTDPNALAKVIESARSAGIPVVFIDTKGINKGVTFIGTDNKAGAKMAADFICDRVSRGSDVAILQGIITQSTGKARADGAHAGLKGCGLNIVAEQPANWDRAQGRTVMENILTRNQKLKAVFASNDNMALGAVEALKDADMLNDVIVVGFDANPDAAKSILAGEMTATIAQFSYNMGAYGVEKALELAKGRSLPPVVDTGTLLVTKKNAGDFK